MTTPIKWTQEQILAKIKATEDFLGFEVSEYFRALAKETLENNRHLLNKDADLSNYETAFKTVEDVRKTAVNYVEFAWEKANNFRGISANRSIAHYRAWLWLMGEDPDVIMSAEYEHYGKEKLIQVCEFLGVDHTQYDDGVRLSREPVE